MKNMIKKIVLIILALVVLALGIYTITSLQNNKSKEYESDVVNKENAFALEFDNIIITNIHESFTKGLTSSAVLKNTSDLNLSQINVYYNELDKNENIVSQSKVLLDMTLKPGDVSLVEFVPKDYTYTIAITGYTYITEDSEVQINLQNNEVKIKENTKYLENSKNYEVLSINKLNDLENVYNSSTYGVEIENISEKNLGNIVLRIGEVNNENQFVTIDHITFNSLLEPGQREEIISSISKPEYEVKILGYTYDDIQSKSNIDIDLVTHKVNIIDNTK